MKRKRIFAVICCVLFLLALVSCNRPNGDTPAPTQESESAEQTGPAVVEGSKTLLIYMCGSNLETKQGLASKNIDELLSATADEKTTIIIQTGGAKKWRKHGISATQSQRYVVKDGELVLLSSSDDANMGSAASLTDFLVWGQNNYLAERNMLILWDHGGGSTKGVCFDENHSFDALTLSELRTAFKNAGLYQKFDVVGFDACLMASVETAAIMRDYADYMVASEEIVPGGGWNYKAIAESFSSKNDPIEIGKDICDSFIEKSSSDSHAAFATLSLIDLSKIDSILNELNKLGNDLSDMVGKNNAFSLVSDSAKRCEKFGYDNVFSGSSNMIDLLQFDEFCVLEDFDAFSQAIDAVEEAVLYLVNGGDRDNGGISFFYPIKYNEREINEYLSLNISEGYNTYLATYYTNVPKETIRFLNKGSVTPDGAFEMSLSENSTKYLSDVSYLLIEKDENGVEQILCSDVLNIHADWEHLTFTSAFDGLTRAYRGHRICGGPTRISEDQIEYAVPVILDGKNTLLIYCHYTDSEDNMTYFVKGIRNWRNEDGLPDFVHLLSVGSRIRIAESVTVDGDQTIYNYGDEFIVEEIEFHDLEDLFKDITEVPLTGSTYYYVFVATDIFGNTYYSDMATLMMTKTAEEIEHGLPDGQFAAEVTNIEPYSTAKN